MPEPTELESLAHLVPSDENVLSQTEMLKNSLASSLPKADHGTVAQVEQEILNRGEVPLSATNSPFMSKTSTATAVADTTPVSNREELLTGVYSLYDGLVSLFETNPALSQPITVQIRQCMQCIRMLGGSVEAFDPLDHMSGLIVPNLVKNAQRVVDNTKQCYRLGTIQNTDVADNGRVVKITFSGYSPSHDMSFEVHGTIESDSWSGNEAVDYIYTPSSGRMAIKAFEEGRWVDKSATELYGIGWDLTEHQGKTQPLPKENDTNIVNEEDNNDNNDESDFPVIEQNISQEIEGKTKLNSEIADT